jgi:acetyltransferase-like isoleucine patch superfamily enzyme
LTALLGSWARVVSLRITQPGVAVGFDSYIGPACDVRCAPGASIRLDAVVVSRGVRLEAGQGACLDLAADLVGENSVIVARERISVGRGSMLGEMTIMRDQDHVVDSETPFGAMAYVTAPIVIGRDVWVAARATILRGVTIGDGAVVAAAAVVNSDVPSGTKVGGIPARPLAAPRAPGAMAKSLGLAQSRPPGGSPPSGASARAASPRRGADAYHY